MYIANSRTTTNIKTTTKNNWYANKRENGITQNTQLKPGKAEKEQRTTKQNKK